MSVQVLPSPNVSGEQINNDTLRGSLSPRCDLGANETCFTLQVLCHCLVVRTRGNSSSKMQKFASRTIDLQGLFVWQSMAWRELMVSKISFFAFSNDGSLHDLRLPEEYRRYLGVGVQRPSLVFLPIFCLPAFLRSLRHCGPRLWIG